MARHKSSADRVNAQERGTPKDIRAIEQLRRQEWVRPLIKEIEQQGGIDAAPLGLRFNLRFAHEMRLACPDSPAQYEFNAGVGGSTVDFLLDHGGVRWLIELVALGETQTIRRLRESSRTQVGQGFVDTVFLSFSAANRHETPFGELVHISEKLLDKVWDKNEGRPSKFPESRPGWGHILVVNMAGFEGDGDPDVYHCREVVLGSSAVPAEYRSDPDTPIIGLFDPRNPRAESIAFRARVDVVAFVAERPGADDDDEIRRTAFILRNPWTRRVPRDQQIPIFFARDQRDPLYRSEEGV